MRAARFLLSTVRMCEYEEYAIRPAIGTVSVGRRLVLLSIVRGFSMSRARALPPPLALCMPGMLLRLALRLIRLTRVSVATSAGVKSYDFKAGVLSRWASFF